MSLRRGLLAVLLGAVGALSAVSSANATTVAAAGCTISGDARAGVSWVDTQVNAGFTFNSLVITCTGSFVQNGVAGVGVVTVPTTSNGSFTNIACGTGSAGDPAPGAAPVDTAVVYSNGTVNSGLASAILANTNLSYNIVFVGGQGAFTWSQTPNTIPGTPNTAIPDNSTTGKYIPVGAGAINISPTWGPGSGGIGPLGTGPPSAPPPVGAASGLCTNGFTVLGDVGLAIVATNK
jgi:hypothetical protein